MLNMSNLFKFQILAWRLRKDRNMGRGTGLGVIVRMSRWLISNVLSEHPLVRFGGSRLLVQHNGVRMTCPDAEASFDMLLKPKP